MQTSLARWRKTFWIATTTLALSLFGAEVGAGFVAVVVGVSAAMVAAASFITLLADPASRQPHIH